MEKNHERVAILLFILVFIMAVVEFVILPDGIGLRLFNSTVRHYYRLKPLFILAPVIIGSLGAGMIHHGTVKKGLTIFIVAVIIFAVNIFFQL